MNYGHTIACGQVEVRCSHTRQKRDDVSLLHLAVVKLALLYDNVIQLLQSTWVL